MIEGLPAIKIMDDTRLPIDLGTQIPNLNGWHEQNTLMLPIINTLIEIQKTSVQEYVRKFIYNGSGFSMPTENPQGAGKGDGVSYLCGVFLLSAVKEGTKVLDVACGRGQAGIWFSTKGATYVGVDVSMSNVGFGLYLTMGLVGVKTPLPTYRQMLAEDLHFEDKSFDIVFTSHAIEHFHNLDRAMSEQFRVGKMICGVINKPIDIECGQHMYKIDRDVLTKYLGIGCSDYHIEERDKEFVYWGACK